MASTLRKHLKSVDMVQNNAGGDSFTLDKWARLNRFLILGVEGGTYYVGEKSHVKDNVTVVDECLNEDHLRTLGAAVDISQSGRAPKNDYAIFVIARGASHSSVEVRIASLAFLNDVCRTGTHLFQFVSFVDAMRGWGPSLRKAVANWYLSKDADKLAYQVLKYQNREGWSHRDVLRKVHPVTNDERKNAVLRYVVKGLEGIEDSFALPDIIVNHGIVHQYNDPKITADKIRQGLSREMIPTEHMNERIVQEALAEKMPYTALMRNLGNLTRHGVIAPNKWETLQVSYRLRDEDAIKKARVHPINILTALRTYQKGTGFRGSNSWTPEGHITAALDDAFYMAFKNVEPTGKRFLVGLDVSGSMSWNYDGGPLTAAEIGAALLMMLVRTEPFVKPMAFSHGFVDLGITPRDSLNDVLRKTEQRTFGGTDCGLPMKYAKEHNIPVDTFIVITDNETWYDRNEHPAIHLEKYRQRMGIDSKLIVLATEATEFSIADPTDRGMLDIAGFDSSVPEIIRQFTLGEI